VKDQPKLTANRPEAVIEFGSELENGRTVYFFKGRGGRV